MSDAIEVFVTDLDHTLLHPETESLPDRIPDMLETWMEAGNVWIIATGRTRDYLEDIMAELGVHPNYYITRSRYIHPGRSRGDRTLEEWNATVETLTEKQADYAEEWIPEVQQWADKEGLSMDVEDEGYVIFDSAETAERAFHFVSDRVNDDFKVLRNREFLIVVPAQTGKGNCLKHLSETMGWEESEIFCVGDGMNDANMLDGDYDFRKAVVANAEPQLKDLVTQHGGLVLEHVGGHAIEELLETLIETHVDDD